MNYYQRLRDIREDRDITQKEIADILGIKQTHYSRYELGKVMMGIDKYIILAEYYNVSLDYLAGITNTPKTIDGKAYNVIKSTAKGSINIAGNSGNITITGEKK